MGPEHYTRNTVSCTVWCNKCGKSTEHRVDDGRRGPCNVCIAKLNAEHEARVKAEAENPPAKQGELF